MFVNLNQSWSSKTKTFGYDQQICPGNQELPWRSLAKLKAREDKIEDVKKQETEKKRKVKIRSGTLVDGCRHSRPGLLLHLLLGEKGASLQRIR